MKLLRYTFLIALHIIISTSQAHSQARTATKPIEPLLDSLEQVLESARAVGAMVSIVTKDSILYNGGIGYADRASNTVVTDQHLFRMGSISKSFTAICLLHLLEEEGYTLDTPIKSIIPNLPIDNEWADTHPVTSAHILAHTAGFDDLHMYAWSIEDTIQPSAQRQVELSKKSLLVRWQPGTKFSYSNPGFLVAGQLIEHLSGQQYGDYIRQQLLEPIGMTATGFHFTKPTRGDMAECYHNEGGIFTKSEFRTVNAGAAGDLISNASDMAKFLQFILNKGIVSDSSLLLSPAQFDRIEVPKNTLAVQYGLDKGYGLANGNSWSNGFEFHGHTGAIPWYSSKYIYSREADIGIAVSVNANGFPDEIINSILDYYHPPIDLNPHNKSRTPIPDAVIDQYAGFYHYKNHRNQLTAFAQNMVEGRELVITSDSIATYDFWGSPRSTYYHDQNNLFFRKGAGINSVALFMDGGKPVFWQNSDYALKTNKTIKAVEFIFAISALVFTILFFIYGIIQALINIISSKRKFTPSFTWLWTTSIASIVAAFSFAFSNLPLHNSMKTVLNITFILSTVAFLALSLLSVIIYFRRRPKGTLTIIYYGLSAALMAGGAIYLLFNGIIGLRLWDY